MSTRILLYLFSLSLSASATTVTFNNWIGQGITDNASPIGFARTSADGIDFDLTLTSNLGNLRVEPGGPARLGIYGSNYSRVIDAGGSVSETGDDESLTFTLKTQGIPYSILALNSISLGWLNVDGETIEFTQGARVLAGWNSFDSNHEGFVDDRLPDTLASGFQAILGDRMLPESSQGGGSSVTIDNDWSDLTYGPTLSISPADRNGSSAMAMNTLNGPCTLDFQITNNTQAVTTIDRIVFDLKGSFGSQGAHFRLAHWGNSSLAGNPSDLNDAWSFRSLLEATLPDGDLTTVYQYDVSTDPMLDVTLHPGERAAFRIQLDDNGSQPEQGIVIDNLAIIGTPVFTYVSAAANHDVVYFNYDGSGGAVALEGLEPLTQYNRDDWSLKLTARERGASAPTRFILKTLSFDYAFPSAPTTTADDYEIESNTTTTITTPTVLGNDIDDDLDPFTALLVGDVSNGTLNLRDDGSFTYTPAPGFTGTDRFTYVANDGTFDSAITTVTLNVSKYSGDNGQHYVDNYLGNDSNDGSSPARAWKTLHAVNIASHLEIRYASNADKPIYAPSSWVATAELPNSPFSLLITAQVIIVQ